MYSSQRFYEVSNKVTQYIVLGYQAVAVLVFVVGLYFSYGWLKNPFIGGFFEHTMVLNGSDSRETSKWELYAQGFKVGDQLLSVNGKPITNSDDLKNILSSAYVGQKVSLEIRMTSGEIKISDITLQSFSFADRVAYYILPAFLSLVFLVVSLWIFGLRRSEPAGRAFSMMTSSLAIVIGALFELYTSHHFTYLWTLAIGITGGAFIDLALGFPQEVRFVVSRPYLRWIGYLVGMIIAVSTFGTLFNFNEPIAYINAWGSLYKFTGASALFYFASLLYQAITSYSPVVKSQSRTILIGSLFAFGPTLIWVLVVQQPFNPYLFLWMIVFPLVNGYVIMRFRLLRTDYWMRQSLVYALLTVFVVVAYGLIASGLGTIVSIQMNNPFLISGLVFLIAIFLDPLRTRLQILVDSTFFRGQRAYDDRMRAFSHQLTRALDLHTIGRTLREQIESSLMPDRIYIYTYDLLNDQYAALPEKGSRPTSDLRFASNSPLVQYFQKEDIPLYIDTVKPPPILEKDKARLSLLGAHLFVKLRGEDRPVGWLALGTPLSGSLYTLKDLEFLDNLADQASIAISRMQMVVNLERRVQEMNALTRVSQGVNATMTFDDVLELIFVQTSQIIPSSHFHITLYNKAANYFYYGFRVDDNKRIETLENQPIPVSLDLGQEIIRKGRPIITQDYTYECQARNITPATQGIHAWMGVPLNSGTETMGALSVGSPDATVTYTRAQLDLLQAISDQTVGAIIKARLLQETQERAHQLTTLNEIMRQLTSTLEQEPLLHNILEDAVSILNCEAGTLFLMDEQNGDLVFRVTVGPVATNLIGQRLPAGTGIVGRAVQMRAPVIENDAQRSVARYAGAEKQTGFTSRSLLAVPMQIKDRVLGVIEVINRRDGMPFMADDQNLLTSFAGQAAVAIENARLLALTDQKLAARVEELQVMQRIDRELNTSLEIDRAMRITLEWAMRQSNADAGLIGMVEELQLRLMAQQGYEDTFADQYKKYLPLELPSIKSVIETGQPIQISLVDSDDERVLQTARTQIIIPIRREAQVIGLLFLESNSESQENISFLSRLSDHASIAISNAQLFAEVQRANLANVKLTELDKKKNEFLSIVSHELRTPLTPVQSCIQNLLAGEYGPLTDKQRSRLEIALANTREEARLINNLLDLARIEEGKEQLKLDTGNLAKIIKDVVTIFEYDAENKGIELINLVTPSDKLEIKIDVAKIKQVVTNLISNAIKFTPERGKITVLNIVYQDRVEIIVKDTGIGIPPDQQTKVFDRFYQVDTSLTRKIGGTGIGLSIVKTYVELHNGNIWVESIPDSGSIFHFILPIQTWET